MEEVLGNDPWYSGVEPTEIGDLTDVREQRTVIPATKGVEVRIKKAEIYVKEEENPETKKKVAVWKTINLQLQITQGLADGKYKGKVVFARVTYFADSDKYTSEFFRSKQHLVQLKMLLRATGIQSKVIDGYTVEQLEQAPSFLSDIIIKKNLRIVGQEELSLIDTNNPEEVHRAGLVKDKKDRWCFEVPENEARNFKAIIMTSTI